MQIHIRHYLLNINLPCHLILVSPLSSFTFLCGKYQIESKLSCCGAGTKLATDDMKSPFTPSDGNILCSIYANFHFTFVLLKNQVQLSERLVVFFCDDVEFPAHPIQSATVLDSGIH